MLVKLLARFFFLLCYDSRVRFMFLENQVHRYLLARCSRIYGVLHGSSQAMQKVCVNERLCVMRLILRSSEKGGSWVSYCSQAEPGEANEYKKQLY